LVASIVNSIYRRFYYRLTPDERFSIAWQLGYDSQWDDNILLSPVDGGEHCLEGRLVNPTPADWRKINSTALDHRMTMDSRDDGSNPHPYYYPPGPGPSKQFQTYSWEEKRTYLGELREKTRDRSKRC